VLRTKFLAPAHALAEGWERANDFLEGLVQAALARGRSEGGFGDGPLHREACEAAVALLAQGEREAAKDLLRALARAREIGEVAPGLVPDLGRLLIGFRAWTADEAFLDRYRSGLTGLDPSVPLRPTPRRRPEELVGLSVVGEVIERLWGLWPDAPAGGLHLAPLLEPQWREMALLGLRIGTTSLDLRVRRSASGYTLTAGRTQGPRLRLTVWLEELAPTGIRIDEEPLGGTRAVFDLAGEHELQIDSLT